MAFNNFPYTSFQDLNLDWVLRKVREAVAQATQATTTVAGYAARLLNIETNDTLQNQKISTLETNDSQQNQRISTLENSDSAQNTRLNTVESNISTLNTQVGRNTSDLLDAVKVVSQEFDSGEKAIARSNIGAGDTSVSYYPNTNTLVIRDEVTGDTETVNLTSATSGYDNIRKLLYNETTHNVVYYDGTTTTPYTGSEVIANFMSNGKILTFMEGALDRGQGNILYNDYMPLHYNVALGGGVFFYRIYDNNIEIVKLPLESSVGIKTITPINDSSAVLYTPQTLTEAQKAQARTNISAGTTTTRVNAGDGTITITDPTFASGNPMTYQYKTIFQIIAVYSNGEYTFDRNQADILSAIQNGMLPVVRYHTTTGQSDYHVYYEWVLDYYTYNGEDVCIYFSRVDQHGNSAQLKWYASTGKATEDSRPTLPPATSADEGKIPRVNSFGNYQLVSIPAAENTSFGT